MDESTQKKIQSIAKQYYKNTVHISQQMDRITSVTELYMKEFNKKLKPLLDFINKEYNIDQKKYNKAIQELCDRGFYLPLFCTPREYIEMNSYSDSEIEQKYLNLFEETNGNHTDTVDMIFNIIEEYSHPDWEETIKKSIDVSQEIGVDKTYNLFYSLYFCYLEFIIRDELPAKGRKETGFRKLFTAIKNSISIDPRYSESQQEFFNVLAQSAFDNYYKYVTSEKLNTVSRNTIFHGYIGADKITKIDFYKQISLLTHFIYFLNRYKSSNKNT